MPNQQYQTYQDNANAAERTGWSFYNLGEWQRADEYWERASQLRRTAYRNAANALNS